VVRIGGTLDQLCLGRLLARAGKTEKLASLQRGTRTMMAFVDQV